MIKEGIAEETKKQDVSRGKGKFEKDNGAKVPGQPKTPTLRKNVVEPVKSPSDTTIYAPALRLNAKNDRVEQEKIIDRISDFVEEIRFESATGRTPPPQKRTPRRDDCDRQESEEEFQRPSDQLIVEAEQFKVMVEPPPQGKVANVINRGNSNELDSDDDYFHLTCHVDNALKTKIEHGEFIELERLLPKRQGFDDSRLEWISKDGMTFLAPAQDRSSKITNIRKWDQVFRVYATIYCNANPGRAGEIWQYIYTIHSAASSYQWDNVSYYDTTFRQMMSERPHRNWAKTYMQLWQLALRDPIQRNNNRQSGSGAAGTSDS